MRSLARDVPSAWAGEFAGEIPPVGALLTYVLLERMPPTNGSSARGGDSVTLTIRDASGRVVRELCGLFASGWGTLESRLLDLHGVVQTSTAGPTEAQQCMFVACPEELLRGVAELNAMCGGLSTWRSPDSGAGTAPQQVRPPPASP
jgi:hypothetical protein